MIYINPGVGSRVAFAENRKRADILMLGDGKRETALNLVIVEIPSKPISDAPT